MSVTVTEYVRQRQNSKKKFQKIDRRISRSLEYTECRHSMLLFCKEWHLNEQIIITHAYTAIAPFALLFAYF